MALTKVKTGVVDDSVFAANKNVIINGNFDIWQRGTSFIAPASADYTADRFIWGAGGTGVVDVLQSTSVPDNTSEFSLQVDVTTADTSIAAGDNYAIQTRIEGYDLQRFGFGSSDATSLTLSFWVLSSKTGIHCISLKNNDSTRSFIIEYTVNVADTWEYKTNTLTADTTGTWLADNGTGIKIIFNLAAGSTFHTTAGSWTAGNFLSSSNQVNVMDSTANNFHLSRVQLEVGSAATAFERRSFAQEFAMCQRYYAISEIIYLSGDGDTGSTNRSYTTSAKWPVQMRTSPSLTKSGESLSNAISVAVEISRQEGCRVLVRAPTVLNDWSSEVSVIADAEL